MIRATDEPTAAGRDVDQAELALNPTRTRVCAPRGGPWPLETPGDNRTQVLCGAVNSRTGQTHVRRCAHKRSADFQVFVDHVLIPAYPHADFLCLIVAGASIYRSKSTRQWLAQRPQVGLVPLPSYAPKLNLHEEIWRWLRAAVTHNHFFGPMAALLAATDRFCAPLADLPQAVLRRLGRTFPSLVDHYLATIL
jgi:hypothetical protein